MFRDDVLKFQPTKETDLIIFKMKLNAERSPGA